MKLAICGSLTFAEEMQEVAKRLEEVGHFCELPKEITVYRGRAVSRLSLQERVRRKLKAGLMRRYFAIIGWVVEGIVVVNPTKEGVEHYIGGNTFLEMGEAFKSSKVIFVLYDLPTAQWYHEELLTMEPVVLKGDLSKIPAEMPARAKT